MSETIATDRSALPTSGAAPLRYFRRVAESLDVAPVLAELEGAPELWDAHGSRTAQADGPMADTSDIWIRYFAPETLREPADFLREGRCVFYPAWDRLPSIHSIVFDLMRMCRGVELGGILISRIPPFGRIGTHVDGAAWTARYYSRKFYIPLKAGPGCVNRTLDEALVIAPGEVVEFDNLAPHSVSNDDPSERINLIVTLRGDEA